MRRTRIRYDAPVYSPTPWPRTMAKVLAYCTGAIAMYICFIFLVVNWVSQCGSRIYTDAYTWQMGECFSMATIVTEWLW